MSFFIPSRKNDVQYEEACKNLKNLKQAKNNPVDAVIKGGYYETISQKLKEVKSQIESCNQLISTLKTHQEGLVVTEEDVRKYIGKLKGYIKDPLCKEQVKFALSQFK